MKKSSDWHKILHTCSELNVQSLNMTFEKCKKI